MIGGPHPQLSFKYRKKLELFLLGSLDALCVGGEWQGWGRGGGGGGAKKSEERKVTSA